MEQGEGRQISYMALQTGTPVLASSGNVFGAVEHVLQIPEEDLFDGIVVKTDHHQVRFVDRDQIGTIFTNGVHCLINDDDVANLPEPRGPLVLHPDNAHDEGPSLTARWGRLFGRQKWKELE